MAFVCFVVSYRLSHFASVVDFLTFGVLFQSPTLGEDGAPAPRCGALRWRYTHPTSWGLGVLVVMSLVVKGLCEFVGQGFEFRVAAVVAGVFDELFGFVVVLARFGQVLGRRLGFVAGQV